MASNMENGIIAVIPAYREEIAIGSVVLKARKHVDRVIVVDDGSPDRTAEVAELRKRYRIVAELRNSWVDFLLIHT
jgi:glycosyltransferase involved in cell wall biosynthesis